MSPCCSVSSTCPTFLCVFVSFCVPLFISPCLSGLSCLFLIVLVHKQQQICLLAYVLISLLLRKQFNQSITKSVTVFLSLSFSVFLMSSYLILFLWLCASVFLFHSLSLLVVAFSVFPVPFCFSLSPCHVSLCSVYVCLPISLPVSLFVTLSVFHSPCLEVFQYSCRNQYVGTWKKKEKKKIDWTYLFLNSRKISKIQQTNLLGIKDLCLDQWSPWFFFGNK